MQFHPQWFLLVLLFGCMALAGFFATGHRLRRNAIRLAQVPLAFLLAFLLHRGGIFAGVTEEFFHQITVEGKSLAEFLGDFSALSAEAVRAILNVTLAALLFGLLFLFLLLALRFLFFILSLCIPPLYGRRSGAPAPVWHHALSFLCGAASWFLILGVLLTPFFFFSGIAAAAELPAGEGEGSTVYETITIVEENYVAPFEDATVVRLYTATGVRGLVCRAVADGKGCSIRDAEGNTAPISDTLRALVSAFAKGSVGTEQALLGTAEGNEKGAVLLDGALTDISGDRVLPALTADLLRTYLQGADTENEFLLLLRDTYGDADAAQIAGDIRSLSPVLHAAIAADLPRKWVNGTPKAEEILASFADRAVARDLLDGLSGLSFFLPLMQRLAPRGVEMLAGALDIPKDTADLARRLDAALSGAFNDRSIGAVDYDDLDRKMAQAAKDGVILLPVDGIGVGDALPSGWETARQNCKRHFARVEKLVAVLVSYGFADADLTSDPLPYLTGDGAVYLFDVATGCWHLRTEADETIRPVYLLADRLARKTNAFLYEDALADVVSEEAISLWLMSTPGALADNAALTAKEKAGVGTLCAAVKDRNFPAAKITQETLCGSLDFSPLTEEDGRQKELDAFAVLFSDAAGLSSLLAEGDAMTEREIVEQFDRIGALFDDLHATKSLASLSRNLLRALEGNETYGAYLASFDVESVIADVDAGNTTYREFFTTLKNLILMMWDLVA